ncbi:uncharacterized protein LOC132728446 [Ruditapes philippinarum]|uniref:uncharacterized protein LOC132728446 n=1 Tax=Ruditapes philippinarum TaxID=129788 RepID=UPI00295AB500|nr:uncharacterized protein LOC132728446 [Ruditapes philippinarum]
MATSTNREDILNDSSRSSVVENQGGLRFLHGFDDKNIAPVPKRLNSRMKGYKNEKKTAEELASSLKLAEERKQKHMDNVARQARLVSEEAVRYDKNMQSKLGLSNQSRQLLGNKTQSSQSKGGKWYSHALKKD